MLKGEPKRRWCAVPRASCAIILPSLLLALISGCAQDSRGEVKSGQNSIILNGIVAPIEKADVMSPANAIVMELLTEQGQRVSRGAVLLRLDASTLSNDVRRAEAALDLARANLGQAESVNNEAQLAEARAEVERLQQEYERERKLAALAEAAPDYQESLVILRNARAKLDRLYSLLARELASKPEVETAENEWAEAQRRFEAASQAFERRRAGGDFDVKIAEARASAGRARVRGLEIASRLGSIPQARAQVREAEANLAQAKYNLAAAVVEAPIGGIITSVKVHRGEKVYERSPLVSIDEINRVRVQADLSPGLLFRVRVGQTAQVTVNTVPPTTVTSTVASILSVADAKTQSLGLTVILPNPDLKFQPGFTARVELPLENGTSPAPPVPGAGERQ
jgi:multidrug resistance efflux pump